MSVKGLETQRNTPLNKKLKEFFWGAWCMQTNWNYERQMNTAYMYGMSHTIDRLYPDEDELEKKKEAYHRHLEFFNITPQCAALTLGISAAMEEEYAADPENFDPSVINSVKVALMGPLSGIGDSLFQGTIRIIAMSIGISLAQQGSILGPILAALISIFTSVPFTWYMAKLGYTRGQEFVRQMSESNLMEKVMFVCSIAGLFVIGGMSGMKYREYEIQLNPGDKIFVYTDGINEAMDERRNMFGTERIVRALNEAGNAPAKTVLETVRESVRAFVRDTEQFDDMTMLCLEYSGPQKETE
jgi:PTS system mannose-specific IID component/fructoselysine and glucoselysine-specific PTS system IID component